MKSKIDHRTARRIAAVVLFAAAASSQAATITGTVDTSAASSPTNQSADGTTYFNAPYSGAFPAAPVTVGAFDFAVPAGSFVSGATVSGDFGSDALGSGTAEVDLFLNAVEVASCDAGCANASQSADVAWSFTFTPAELASFASGTAVLTAVQQGVSQIVLDPTTVTLDVTAVPEPGSLPMMLGVLPLIAFGLRRARARRA